MLRLFWPNTDANRRQSDVDASSSAAVTWSIHAGRFANTAAVSAAGSGSSLIPLPVGFLRTFDLTNGTPRMRIAFDYFHASSGSNIELLSVASTAATSSFGNTSTSSSTLMRVFAGGATNKISVGFGGNTITYAGNTSLQNLAWHHIEVEFYPHNTAGVIKVWVNDVEQTSITTTDTLHGTATVTDDLWVYFGCIYSAGLPSRVSNLVLWDDSGTDDDLKGFLGDFTPIRLLPTANGDNIDGVPSAGNNYAAVNDSSDSTYVTLQATGDYDLYEVAAIGVTGTVKAVVVMAEGYLAGNGTARLKGVAKIAGTEQDSTVSGDLLVTYSGPRNVLQAAFAQNPATNAAWTVANLASDVNSAQFGVKFTVV